ncbi:MAG: hypothetical protein CVT62_09465 [Actinobacteria bacterium HGW-Actinobacteria-2]|nr:MAG: hypothetical protein CVT62_09465 [Actinobacteria bacterium HGW-Actinobacteria-2]
MTAEAPLPVTAEASAPPVTAEAAVAEIATLPPLPNTTSAGVNPRTGEPRRPWLIRVATVLLWLATATAAASLLWTYWIAVEDLIGSSWLTSRFERIEVGYDALLAVALTVAMLLPATGAVITGYYAWFGHRWTRIAGIITTALSLLMLLLNPIGWAVIPLAAIGTGLLWLPQARSFFDAWQAHRHPETAFAPPQTSVYYGPLPRYRKD